MQGFWGELIGTMTLILLGNGVVAGVSLKGSYAENGGWIVNHDRLGARRDLRGASSRSPSAATRI